MIHHILNKIKFSSINSEETSYDEAIRSRSSIVEVKVPADCVRPIIGSQGCVIKEVNVFNIICKLE